MVVDDVSERIPDGDESMQDVEELRSRLEQVRTHEILGTKTVY